MANGASASAAARPLASPIRIPASRPFAPLQIWAFGEDGVSDVCVLADEIDTQQVTDHDRNRLRQARRLFPEAEVMLAHEYRRASGSVFQGSFPPD